MSMAFITNSFVSQTLGRYNSSAVSLLSPLSPRLNPSRFIASPNFRSSRVSNTRIARMSATGDTAGGSKMAAGRDPKTVSDAEWREMLTTEEYRILREKGTEHPGTGEYEGFYPKEGHFVCRACSNPLYSASSKFKSGCGWPAFDKCYKNSIATNVDMSFGSRRVEIVCAKCDGHLGHVFEGESMTVTNERHCVNSVSVKFIAEQTGEEEGKLM